MSASSELRVVALAGGVGGARLVDGLDRVLPPGTLTVIVNTGDDFTHWGLHISPDLDTIMYTLAGLAPEERGWGIADDTFHVLREAERRSEDTWFQLGDRDLVTHLSRTAALRAGDPLTEVTDRLRQTLGVDRPILPMSDEPRPTVIVTETGEALAFQQWLVAERAARRVSAVRYGPAQTTPQVLQALDDASLVVLCPSNPYVSIDPILTLPGVRERVRATRTIAISPIVGGRAVKGPLAGMLESLAGASPSAEAIARHYGDLVDTYVIHHGDHFESSSALLETDILIPTAADRVRLAGELLELARSLS